MIEEIVFILYQIVLVYLHSAFSSQVTLFTRSPQLTNRLGFSSSSQSMVQWQEVLAGYISGQLGDCRIPEGPDTSPPHSMLIPGATSIDLKFVDAVAFVFIEESFCSKLPLRFKSHFSQVD